MHFDSACYFQSHFSFLYQEEIICRFVHQRFHYYSRKKKLEKAIIQSRDDIIQLTEKLASVQKGIAISLSLNVALCCVAVCCAALPCVLLYVAICCVVLHTVLSCCILAIVDSICAVLFSITLDLRVLRCVVLFCVPALCTSLCYM